ncbi:MAG: hypothetical protein BWY14_00543 [Parcubacteria group bacterium ADurb.Bin192]|nr:MAG: hypothetical protein BWY14_00543 [Parcubacteria group bacterium ADurb.Bin192]
MGSGVSLAVVDKIVTASYEMRGYNEPQQFCYFCCQK